MIRVEHGDMLEVIPRLVAEGVVCDAVVTDPPYHLTDMTKRFGSAFKAEGHRNTDGTNHYQRLASGFMGQQWDGGDIAFRPETWTTVATILRPGAFLVAFGGTRTYHRLVSAIEDAGFVIQDQIAWMFATGFPKRRDMLKPAFEPIVLAYKPGGKRTMQVDECRIAGAMDGNWSGIQHSSIGYGGTKPKGYQAQKPAGRWPANICHDGSDEVAGLFPESAAGQPQDDRGKGGFWGASDGTPCGPQYGDGGSAARFFYSAKAGPQDRWGSRHPTVKPVDLIAWLVKLVTPPGGTFLDPFAGSGTAAVAALKTGRNAILIEREAAYVADIRERIAFYEGGGKHSSQAKHRNRKVDHGPLFAETLTPEEDAADSLASYNAAVHAIGERVKAGGSVPEFMLSRKAPA